MGRVESSLFNLQLLYQVLVDKASFDGHQRICKEEPKDTFSWINVKVDRLRFISFVHVLSAKSI